MAPVLRSEVHPHHGAPTLFLDGNPHTALAFFHPRARDAREDFGRFARAGVDLLTFSLGAMGNGGFDAEDETLAQVFAAHPRALILPRVHMEPPRSWEAEHPDDVMLRYKVLGGAPSHERPSFSSERWKKDASGWLVRFVEHMESRHPGRIYGYHLCAGHCGEWAYSWDRELSDYSPVQRAAFRAWLRARYGSDREALRAAWKSPDIDFDTIEIPRCRDRPHDRDTRLLSVFDPAKERGVVDYLTFHSEPVADAILAFCHTAKETLARLGRTKIVGVFYGYHFFIQGNAYGLHDSGHHALGRVLSSPDIDFIAAPINYQERHAGGFYHAQLIAGSVREHGKLYYAEDDTFTHRAAPFPNRPICRDATETGHVLWRNLVGALRDGGTQWWMDLFGGGWYLDDAVMREVAAMRVLAEERLLADRTPSAEIAVVASPESMRFVRYDAALIDALIANQLTELTAIGAPYDVYSDGDLDRVFSLPSSQAYKLVIFIDSLFLSDVARRAITEKVATRGRTLLFVYAAGLLTANGISTDAMSEITGMRVAVNERHDGLVGSLKAMTFVGGTRTIWGTDEDIGPHLSGNDEQAEILGWLVQRGEPALLRRAMGDWTSVWSAAPMIPATLLRHFAREAGVHVYLETGEQVLAERGLVAVHASRSGARDVCLRQPSDVVDVRTGNVVATHANRFTTLLERGETRVWRLLPRP
jgi:hypothetical protein